MIAGGDLPDLVSYNLKFQEADDLIPLEDKIAKSAPAIKQALCRWKCMGRDERCTGWAFLLHAKLWNI